MSVREWRLTVECWRRDDGRVVIFAETWTGTIIIPQRVVTWWRWFMGWCRWWRDWRRGESLNPAQVSAWRGDK
jgi:hypothetical protein